MNRIRTTFALLSLMYPLAVVAQVPAQASNTNRPGSVAAVQNGLSSAHSRADYQRLAEHYHQQETEYRAKAAAEKVELERRAKVNAALYQKYPRPVDSAQYLYESYISTADRASLQAHHYDQLATGQAQGVDQPEDSTSRAHL